MEREKERGGGEKIVKEGRKKGGRKGGREREELTEWDERGERAIMLHVLQEVQHLSWRWHLNHSGVVLDEVACGSEGDVAVQCGA
jgi:hypothetical protein